MSRDRVLLRKIKFDEHGEFDRSDANSRNVKIAHLDMSSAVANSDYWSRQTVTATFREQHVHITRFDMSWAGYGRAHCDDFAQASELNTLPWEVKLNSATNRYEFAGFSTHYRPIEIGVKPADWDIAWQWKYYTKYETNFYWADSNYVPVTYPRGIENNTNNQTPYTAWDASTQYYVADEGWEINQIWVTDRLMTFGGWQSFETYGTGNNPAYMCGFVNGYRSLGIRLYADGSYANNWKYTGGRVGFARLDTDIRRITSYIGTMSPASPSGGHVNTYRSRVPFVENSARTKLINEGKWSVLTFCKLVAFTLDNVNYIGYLMGYSNPNNLEEPYVPIIYAIEDLADQTLSPWGVEPPPPDDDPDTYHGPISGGIGGQGSYWDPSGIWEETGTNIGWNLTSVGAMRTWVVDYSQLTALLDDLAVPPSSGSSLTIDSWSDVFYKRQSIGQNFENGIIDCWALPFAPGKDSTQRQITVLGESLNAQGWLMSEQQHFYPATTDAIKCDVHPMYDSFLDYEPFTKVWIMIPFIGMKQLPTNQVMGGTVVLKYRQDNMSGDISAIVEVIKSNGEPGDIGINPVSDAQVQRQWNRYVVGVFPGNAKYPIAVTQSLKNTSQLSSIYAAESQMVSGIKQGVQATKEMMVGDIINGSLDAIQSGAMIGQSNVSLMQGMQQPNETGSVLCQGGGSGAWAMSLVPTLVISRPIYSEPGTFGHDIGYFSNVSWSVGDVKGWTSYKNIDISSISATDEEKEVILSALTSGFYQNDE